MDPEKSAGPEVPNNLPQASPVPSAPNSATRESPLKQIRTYQGDVAAALQRQQESLVSIQRQEHAKHGAPSPQASAESKKRKQFFFLSLGSILFIILGGLGAWFAYGEFVRRSVSPIAAGPGNRFIAVNSEITLDTTGLTRSSLATSLVSMTQNVSSGEISHVVMRRTTGTGNRLLLTWEFLETLESQAPGSLTRAFGDLFMFGAIGNSNRPSRFLIIELSSFENAFSGMLQWERSMARDIGPLFSTAPILANTPANSTFVDLTDRNKDIRVLRIENQPVLLYSFFDMDLLIITENIETMRTLVDRLTREKLSR